MFKNCLPILFCLFLFLGCIGKPASEDAANVPVNIYLNQDGVVQMKNNSNSTKFPAKITNGTKVSITTIDGFSGRPFCMNFDANERMYVCDFDSHKMLKYGVVTLAPAGEISGRLNKPHSVDFDSSGNLYICNYEGKEIQKYSADGEFLSAFGSDVLSAPATAYFDFAREILYVSDYGSNRIARFSKNGNFLGWFEPSGLSFDRPHVVREGPGGNLYVVDTWHHRILKISKSGEFLGWIGAKDDDGTITNGWETQGTPSPSSLPGSFNAPTSMDFDANGNFVVSEYGNPRIQLFSKDGKFIGWFGGTKDGTVTKGWEKEGEAEQGNSPGTFFHPYDVKIHEGKLYVADSHNNRVQIIEFGD